MRDEVSDLEKAGIKCIQMDEPAFREGLPLEPRFRNEYLKTSVQAFKVNVYSLALKSKILDWAEIVKNCFIQKSANQQNISSLY